MRTVHCALLKREAEGLDAPPYPGPLGERVFENISKAFPREHTFLSTFLKSDSAPYFGRSKHENSRIFSFENHYLR